MCAHEDRINFFQVVAEPLKTAQMSTLQKLYTIHCRLTLGDFSFRTLRLSPVLDFCKLGLLLLCGDTFCHVFGVKMHPVIYYLSKVV